MTTCMVGKANGLESIYQLLVPMQVCIPMQVCVDNNTGNEVFFVSRV